MMNASYLIRCIELTKQTGEIYKKLYLLNTQDNTIIKVYIKQLEDLHKKRTQVMSEIDDKKVHKQLKRCDENLKKVKNLFERLCDDE